MTAKKKPSTDRYTVGRTLGSTPYNNRARVRSSLKQDAVATVVDSKQINRKQSSSRSDKKSRSTLNTRNPNGTKSSDEARNDRPTPAQRVQPVDKKRFWSRKKIALLIFLIVLSPFLFIAAWDARNLSEASNKMFGSGNLLEAFVPTALAGSERGRVNVLVVGYSADDPGHAGANLTDSIMVLSMDTKDKKGYMLSIPRDMYVTIPGTGKAKINEAYQRGEAEGFTESGYSSGGIGLLQKTIKQSFGISTDYYAIINYSAVRDITNALDGITVDVQSKDPRGLFDPNFLPKEGGPLQLSNGPQKIDGETALKLTRARGATYGSYGFAQSDFDRTRHQQQVLVGIKQGLTWQMLLDPRENRTVLNAIAENVKTDVELNEVVPLFRLFNRIPSEDLQSINLRDVNGKNLLQSYTTSTGQSALIPAAGANDYSEIQAAIQSFSQ